MGFRIFLDNVYTEKRVCYFICAF